MLPASDLKLLCRFKACLDGNPEPSNPIIKHLVPFCVQDPLLLQIVLYTSACFLNETGHLPRHIVMVQKGQVIGMLNEHLRSDSFYTSDGAIAAVIQLIIDEWYWGETQDLQAHLRGIRQMIKIRGGYHKLGMNGLLAKMVIL
jgi:Fungal specific transcription factor domain